MRGLAYLTALACIAVGLAGFFITRNYDGFAVLAVVGVLWTGRLVHTEART